MMQLKMLGELRGVLGVHGKRQMAGEVGKTIWDDDGRVDDLGKTSTRGEWPCQ